MNNIEEDLAEYMEESYQITNAKVNTMMASYNAEASLAATVLERTLLPVLRRITTGMKVRLKVLSPQQC